MKPAAVTATETPTEASEEDAAIVNFQDTVIEEIKQTEVYKKMCERYGPLNPRHFPKHLSLQNFDQYVLVKEKELQDKFAFESGEVKKLVRLRPGKYAIKKDY